MKITTPFAGAPDEVDQDEYEALKRQGLLSDTGPDDVAEPQMETVQTVFGHAVTVDADEAAALRRQGLVAKTTLPARAATPNPGTTPPADTSKENG